MSIDWRFFALGSAFFAALTAIFGKVGVSDINSDLATFYRTIVILAVTALLVSARHEWQAPATLPYKGMIFLLLSGIATGLSGSAIFARCSWHPPRAWLPSINLAWFSWFCSRFCCLEKGSRGKSASALF